MDSCLVKLNWGNWCLVAVLVIDDEGSFVGNDLSSQNSLIQKKKFMLLMDQIVVTRKEGTKSHP